MKCKPCNKTLKKVKTVTNRFNYHHKTHGEIKMDFLTTAGTRGCGTRKEGGLYACTGQSSTGLPIEAFIIDPAIPFTSGPFRGVQWVRREDGIYDLLLWVGAEHYPHLSDFVEEGRIMGFSKRIPINASDNNYEKITFGSSRMLLVHPNAIIKTQYELNPKNNLPDVKPRIERPNNTKCGCSVFYEPFIKAQVPCTFATWDLSGHRKNAVTSANGELATIETPSVKYTVKKSIVGDDSYTKEAEAGIFLALPLTHFEYVSEQHTLPDTVSKKLGNNAKGTAVVPQ